MPLVLGGCEDKGKNININTDNNAPLIGTTYKSIATKSVEWESFTFYENKYDRTCPSWIKAEIEWWGYYSLQDSIIYCYYDTKPDKVEFTMLYRGDSIIKGYEDTYQKIYYKQ